MARLPEHRREAAPLRPLRHRCSTTSSTPAATRTRRASARCLTGWDFRRGTRPHPRLPFRRPAHARPAGPAPAPAPELLILDEPTNHLDTAAVEWLESYIQDWDGAVLVVSHDRYLLDKVCNNVWEMSGAGVETYRGNYSHYLRQRQERWELRSKEFDAEKERLLKEMDYIKRNISAQNVAQSRGRLKRLSRQIQAIEQIGLDAMRDKTWLEISEDVQISTGVMNVEEAEQRLRALRNPLHRPRQLKFRLRRRQARPATSCCAPVTSRWATRATCFSRPRQSNSGARSARP